MGSDFSNDPKRNTGWRVSFVAAVFMIVLIALFVVEPMRAQAGAISDRATLDSILGGGQILEDFETLVVPAFGQRFDAGFISSTSIFDGDGPGLVQPGANYSNPDRFFWNGDGYFSLVSQTLGDAFASRPTTIDYTIPVNAMGFDLQGYSGIGQLGVVEVYDTSLALISSTPVNGGFFGWEDSGGIGRVVVTSNSVIDYIMIDNHAYGTAVATGTPEPSTLILATLGLLGLGMTRRRRRR